MSIKWRLALALVLLSGCAQSGPTGNLDAIQTAVRTGQCFRGEEFANVNFKSDRTAYVATRRGYVYRLDSGGACFDGAVSLTLSQPRLSRDLICTADRTAVIASQWRGAGGRQCVVTVSGPIRDSRESGLWSRYS